MNTRRLLAWTDLEERRRLGTTKIWARRVAIAVGLAALVAWRQAEHGPVAAFATWHSVVTVVFAVAMLATALGMFWRHDAGMLARLPIAGDVLLRAALVRAARSAVVAAGVTIAAAGPLIATAVAASPDVRAHALDALLRGLLLVGTLTIAAAALIPAAAAAAALLVAGGQVTNAARAMVAVGRGETPRDAVATPRGEQLPTTALGALPGTAAAWMVILAITVRWWMLRGGDTAIGPALPWLAASVGVSLLALVGVWRRGAGMAVALREVAALDRQRLAHLEIHPPRGLEVVVMKSLGARAGLIYSKYARLMRRRYPMAWVVGLIAWAVGIGLAIWKPDDAVIWALGVAGGTAVYAVVLAARLGRPPIELPRLAAQLPIGPAPHARARIAWCLTWIAVFAAPPTALAAWTVARTEAGSAWLVVLAVLGVGTLASIVVSGSRR
jgi:hypothetical protein